MRTVASNGQLETLPIETKPQCQVEVGSLCGFQWSCYLDYAK
jgi:hypothetical protein